MSKSVLAVILLITISSCQSNDNIADSKQVDETISSIKLIDNSNKLISQISDPDKVIEVEKLLQTKTPLLRKILPIFTMQIIVESNNKKTVWLFEKPNYLKLKSKKSTQVYILDEDKDLLSLLSKPEN